MNISNPSITVAEGELAYISIITDNIVDPEETVNVQFTIEPSGGAISGEGGDYSYNSPSAIIENSRYTDTKSIAGSSRDLQISISVLQDEIVDPGKGFTLTINSVGPNARP